ncbi:hypothetical protein OG884_35595 [Streptosporangium sp. NBC_01755]|uniref:hypothetical protein n=1 Tax=unclassified Streptosporangium TaxID=2632669 RepID=UPI002DD826FF|nr:MULTISPECIES: hypothetical protein [unclassified Streptosporangium]WSA28469.1 hypothetical protein OIE13_11660 [Streptosporangium sp. NBC_01810]WSD00040.1 hypothetical protein OG884_35595 [Streptosporangium sp. NBC_01755]
MSEFAAELRARIADVDGELELMRQASDDHGVEVLSGRLENLLRIADRHGVEVRHSDGGPAVGAA